MEEKEFHQRMESVGNLMRSTSNLKAGLRKDSGQYLVQNLSSILEMIDKRDKALARYMELLSEFSFSDEITSPSSIFPGIRTISEEYPAEELAKKTSEMQDCSSTIDILSRDISILTESTLNTLKSMIKNLSDLSIEESQIYDYCIESIRDMDSVYDIGYLKKTTN